MHVVPGQQVAAGDTLLVQEAMKMEVPLLAPEAGRVLAVAAALGEVVQEGVPLVQFLPLKLDVQDPQDPQDPQAAQEAQDAEPAVAELTPKSSSLRPDLLALQARQAYLPDSARPEAVAKRHAAGRLTAREVVAALADPGSFSEYGALAVAAQRSRRSLQDLQANTPADGLITGSATVQGQPVALLVYDYTVLAGTQGVFNHQKADRLLALAAQHRWPVLLWAEGGGGRPGDVDWLGVAGLDCTTFSRIAALSGQVPLIGIVSGHCFAGNAALVGCCDVIVATQGSSLGLGGPAMIEGGGLGVVAAADVGPMEDLAPAGAVDVVVASDVQAVSTAKALLLLLCQHEQPVPNEPVNATHADYLRHAVPQSRAAVYQPLGILQAVCDAGSCTELRESFGRSVVTVLARLGGRPVAVAASRPQHLGGALDAPSCDKLARFMQLADAHGLPLITFVDTPGFMVGPASEKTAMVRHAARVFVAASALRVPVLSVVLRRAFGLGAMALTAGHFHAPVATCAWPGAVCGAMGLEGAVRLGFRKELAGAPEAEREPLFQRLLQEAQIKGQALNMAEHLEIDAVIDPADTRDWLMRHLLASASPHSPPGARSRRFIDPW
jgi:acetyl-CoA carboxylase carboxyltransferase component